jgi:hypothetical protein
MEAKGSTRLNVTTQCNGPSVTALVFDQDSSAYRNPRRNAFTWVVAAMRYVQ